MVTVKNRSACFIVVMWGVVLVLYVHGFMGLLFLFIVGFVGGVNHKRVYCGG